MWVLQHSCVFRCTTEIRVAGTIQLLEHAQRKDALNKSLQQGLLFLHIGLPEPVVKERRGPSIIQYTPSLPLRTDIPRTILFKFLVLLLGTVLLLAAKQIHQSVHPPGQFKRTGFGSGNHNCNCWTNVSHILSCS